MIKVLILNDLHAGTSRPSTTHPGLIRQANTEALQLLESYIPSYNSSKYDLVVNLGDMIRDEETKEEDLQNLFLSLNVYSKIDGMKIFVPGNHEYKKLNSEEIAAILAKLNISRNIPGKLMIEDTLFVWIDSLVGVRDLATIDENTISWLDQNITQGSEIVLFSHYSIPPLDGQANFYFNSDYKYMSYTNGAEILAILERCKSAVTINAHTHMATHKRHTNITSISALSFSENIVAMKYPDANPGIYSVLTIDNDKRYFKSYSGDFCFLSLEL